MIRMTGLAFVLFALECALELALLISVLLLPTAPVFAGSSSSGANAAQIAQYAGSAASAAVGTYLLSECSSTNVLACVMGAQSMIQAGVMLSSAATSGSAKTGTSSYPSTYYPDPSSGSPSCEGADCASAASSGAGSGSSDPLLNTLQQQAEAEYAAVVAQMQQAGVTVSPDGSTITTPDGKSVPTSALGSAAAMSAAGFSDAQIESANTALEKAKQAAEPKLKALARLIEDGGGGGAAGARRGAVPSGEGSSGVYDPFKGLFGSDKTRKSAKEPVVSGMSKRLGSDNIGVAGDNIFEMVTRRYQARDKAASFLKY